MVLLLLIVSAYLVGSTAFAIVVGKVLARRDAPLADRRWVSDTRRGLTTRAPGSRTTIPDPEFIARRVAR